MGTLNEKMTALADEVRELSGSTGKLGIDAMTVKVDAANATVDEQADLIAQIKSAVDNLPEASNGIDLPELTNEGTAADVLAQKQFIDSDGNIVTGEMPNNGALNQTFDGIETTSVTIPAGYTTGGTIGLDDAINTEANEQASLISQIMTALEGKAAGGVTIETCLLYITIDPAAIIETGLTVSYTTSDMVYDSISNIKNDRTIEAAKNTIVVVDGRYSGVNLVLSGAVDQLTDGSIVGFEIHGTATLNVSKNSFGGQ